MSEKRGSRSFVKWVLSQHYKNIAKDLKKWWVGRAQVQNPEGEIGDRAKCQLTELNWKVFLKKKLPQETMQKNTHELIQ